MSAINSSWRRCVDRFDEVEYFIETSGKNMSRNVRPSFRSDVYASWILMAYAACEYSFNEMGSACMDILSRKYPSARRLPEKLLREHQLRTLAWASRSIDSKHDVHEIEQVIRSIHSTNWGEKSRITDLVGNVWPDSIRGWMRRMGVEDADVKWMYRPVPGGSETYESKLSSLVKERNPIAHGESPDGLVAYPIVVELLRDCKEFMEKCFSTLSLRLVIDHRIRLKKVGEIDRGAFLGEKRVAIKETSHVIRVGDHMILSSRGSKKSVIVKSVFCDGVNLDKADIGQCRVSMEINSSHNGGHLLLPP